MNKSFQNRIEQLEKEFDLLRNCIPVVYPDEPGIFKSTRKGLFRMSSVEEKQMRARDMIPIVGHLSRLLVKQVEKCA